MGYQTTNQSNEFESGTFEVYPAGKYLMVISDSEQKENDKKTGEFYNPTFKFIEGIHKDKTYRTWINYKHINEKVQKWGIVEFDSLMFCLGKRRYEHCSELHNIPVYVNLGVKKNKETDKDENYVKSYEPYNQTKTSEQASLEGTAPGAAHTFIQE